MLCLFISSHFALAAVSAYFLSLVPLLFPGATRSTWTALMRKEYLPFWLFDELLWLRAPIYIEVGPLIILICVQALILITVSAIAQCYSILEISVVELLLILGFNSR